MNVGRRSIRATLLLVLFAGLLWPAGLQAQESGQEKSKLRFRPPGSKSSQQNSGKTRIRWGDARDTTTKNAGAGNETSSSAHSSVASSTASSTTAKPAQTSPEDATGQRGSKVVTAAFMQQQDRYANIADPFSQRDQGDRTASEYFSDDNFFGGSLEQGETLPVPPRTFPTQDNGIAPPQVPMPIPQSQGTQTVDCPTKEEMGIRALSSISLDIRPADTVPDECPLFDEPWQPRHWAWVDFHWKASAICHKPLYFEEVPLERYGHSHGMFVQPFVSGAHFFATIPALPYMMGIHHPTDCMYPLGHYRPGNCAPKLLYPLPLSWRGALYQGAASTGLVFLLP